MKLLVPEKGYILQSSWLKGSHRNPQITLAIAKTIGCFPQTPSKGPLLKKTIMQLTKYGEFKLLLIYSLQTYVLASLVQEGTQHATKEKCKTLATNPLIYNGVLLER